MFGLDFGKYRVLVISIALFLIFDLGVLALNFVISSQIAADAVSVNLAGRQRMLSQRTAKSLLEIDNGMQASRPVDEQIKELQKTFKLFDDTFNAFRDGGTAVGGSGEPVHLNRVDKTEGRAILDKAYALWLPYREKVQAVIVESPPAPETVTAAVEISLASNVKLLGLMNELTTHVEQVAASKANFLRIVQVGGITLATINFLLILFHFLRHLRDSDKRLESAKRETDDILQTVSEGLFLLDRDYKIGMQHSAVLNKIFQREDLPGSDFLAFMRGIVSEKTLATAKDYMELLFGERVNEKLVGDLNPLDVVEVNFPDPAGGFDIKFLEFRFSRVYEQGALSHLLVTVNDISDRVKLQRELQASQERSEEQMDLLMEVLHMEPQVLRNFLVGTRDALEGVNDVLKQPVRHQEDYAHKVASIFRLVHSVKGDAAAAGLRSIESAAHEIEDSLDGLRKLPRVSGNDFLALAVRLDILFARVEALDALLQKFAGLQSVAAETRAETSSWTTYEQLAKRVAERQGKRVSFAYRGVDYEAIPQQYRNAIGDMLTQFVRNACVHGIEIPAVRSAVGKSPIGQLSASVVYTNNRGIEFSVRDDGAGLSVEKIRASLIESGRMSVEEAAASPAAKLLPFIFEPAFSTADTIDEDAGRGVGLDLVKTLAQNLGGRIRLSSVPGQYTEFRVSFPPLSAPQSERLPERVAA